MGFKTATRYRLADPAHYDDEFGKGYAYAETYGLIECDGMHIVDCWITDELGNIHPGYDESPVPVRFCNLIADTTEPGMVRTRERSHALWR